MKIKDSVDLKELEKFGMRYNKKYYIKGNIRISKINRKIFFYVDGDIAHELLDKYNPLAPNAYFNIHKVLFDLIQANLVEE